MLREGCCMLSLHKGVVTKIGLNILLVYKQGASDRYYLEIGKIQRVNVYSDP